MVVGLIGLISCSNIGEQTTRPADVSDEISAHSFNQTITPELLRQHLYIVASDSFMGRGTGQDGIDLAADYITTFYKDLGIRGMGDDYHQTFNLVSSSVVSHEAVIYTLMGADSTTIYHDVYENGSEAQFYPEFSGYMSSSGPIVFAGFGIEDEEVNLNHFGDVDVAGKWVVMFSDIPEPSSGSKNLRVNNSVTNRIEKIINTRGAAGLLIIPTLDSAEFERESSIPGNFWDSNPPLQLEYLERPLSNSIPVFNIGPSLAATLLGLNQDAGALSGLYNSIAENPVTFSGFDLQKNWWVRSNVHKNVVPTSNIIGFIEGNDPILKDEYVVLSAHYDHMGIGRPDPTGDTIYNGADDNGSGTVALMSIAKALKEAKDEGYGPKRSVIFLHVSAEEIGLLGSRYYSDHPTVPIQNIIANLNIDMIGRIDDEHAAKNETDYVYIIGAEIISSDLDSILSASNALNGNELRFDMKYNDLNDRNQFYRRSDHWNFGRLRIPFVFFFSGVHADYHRPSDTPDKILYDKYAKITRLVYSTTVELANSDSPPLVDNEAFIRITERIPR
jgi:hypothetical protein